MLYSINTCITHKSKCKSPTPTPIPLPTPNIYKLSQKATQ